MATSIATCRRSQRVIAAFRNAATELLAEVIRMASSPAVREGETTASMIPMMVTTTSISISVTPRRALFPTDDIGIDPFAAGLSIGAQADDIGQVAMLARKLVHVVVAPGILGKLLIQVRTVPLRRIAGLGAQRRQSLLGGGEVAVVELIRAERPHQSLDIGARLGDLRLVHVLPEPRPYQCDEESDDGDHHQHLDEGHACLASFAIPFCALEHCHIATSLMLVIASSMLRINEPTTIPIVRITRGSNSAVKRLMAARVSFS